MDRHQDIQTDRPHKTDELDRQQDRQADIKIDAKCIDDKLGDRQTDKGLYRQKFT